jgi:hypothetical protein
MCRNVLTGVIPIVQKYYKNTKNLLNSGISVTFALGVTGFILGNINLIQEDRK